MNQVEFLHFAALALLGAVEGNRLEFDLVGRLPHHDIMGHGFREQPQIVDFMDITVLGRNVAPSIDDAETLLAGLGVEVDGAARVEHRNALDFGTGVDRHGLIARGEGGQLGISVQFIHQVITHILIEIRLGIGGIAAAEIGYQIVQTVDAPAAEHLVGNDQHGLVLPDGGLVDRPVGVVEPFIEPAGPERPGEDRIIGISGDNPPDAHGQRLQQFVQRVYHAVGSLDVPADEERGLLALAVVDITLLRHDIDPGRQVIAGKGRQRKFQHQVRAGHLRTVDDVVAQQEIDLVVRHLGDRLVIGLLPQIGLHGVVVGDEAGKPAGTEVHGVVEIDFAEHLDPHRKFGLAGKPFADRFLVVSTEHLILERVVAAAQQQRTRYDCYDFTHKVLLFGRLG